MNDESARPNKKQGAEKRDPLFLKLAKYTAIALEFPSTVIGGMVSGYLLDRYFDTAPWFAISITFLAFVVAVVRLVQWAQRFPGEDK